MQSRDSTEKEKTFEESQVSGGGLDTSSLKAYADEKLAIKEIEEDVDKRKKKLAEQETALIDHMIDQGVHTVSLKGGITLSINTLVWAKKLVNDKNEIITAIRESNLAFLVEEGYNSNRLSAYLRELNSENKPIPAALAKVISANPVSKLSAKKYTS